MRKMEWARRPNYIGGIPQRIVFMAIGAFAKAVASLFSSTSYQNANTLIHLVRSLDDPNHVGIQRFSLNGCKLARWVLAAEDICFKNALLLYFFWLGMESHAN
ncbi:N-acylphosphatidylethanolamine synthase [Vitis vinifera]|uniref:Tafazzin family protein n=1 Tax=Vitis vinifera TaxID=29760 RepID=A0A438JHC7_VITVI|nr:N-acylphosphatidylethanolamine synthase [Vitis vinifera]